VDDNADAAEMLEMALNELGCETRISCDGASALRIVESFEPHLAVLDIGLPLMNGYELAARLRQRPGVAKLRLVALTGYGQKSDIERALQAGFDEHLVKPIDLSNLGELLARSIGD
jgi:CheY-like chemotaxis protein